jgi:hypothetical protein
MWEGYDVRSRTENHVMGRFIPRFTDSWDPEVEPIRFTRLFLKRLSEMGFEQRSHRDLGVMQGTKLAKMGLLLGTQ